MAKRKCYKRSRRKQGLYQSQEMLLQKSGSSDTIDSIGNNDTPLRRNVGSSEQLLEQRSPESVLFDSQQLELSCCGDLSPEFAPKLRRRKLDLNNLNTNYEQYESEIQKEMKLFKENQSDVEPQQQKVDTSTLYPMEKTLPMNEEIKVDMHKCESIQNSKSFSNAVLGVRNYNTDFHSFKSMYDLPYGYVSEPGQFSTFNSDVESQNPRFHHFLDEFQSAASSNEHNKEEWNKQESQKAKFDIVNEKCSQVSGDGRFTTNWSEYRRILSNLRQLKNLKVRSTSQKPGTSCLPKYKTIVETRSMYTSSLSLVSQGSWNPKILTLIKSTRIRARATMPYSGSPPPAKRCRTALKCYDDAETEHSDKAIVSLPASDLLSEEKKNTRNSFSSNLTASKTVWSSCTPESPTASTLDLPAVLDSGGCSRSLQDRQVEFEFSKKCTCATSAQSRSSSRFQFIKKPIHKIIFFCIWLMRKLANTFKQNAVNYVVMTLRSENKQMTDRFLEKIRASNVTTMAALITEVRNIVAEKNETLKQEIEKLPKALEDKKTSTYT
ncbi:PREDICTED: LOW QUALITY PROTEIN: uncharacterized protein LOC107190737 [Dufourea novaeangliae]|uniref:LOW QUALITY PROTEIN: uncharacterized protein LOC107190737 n=1 Tax=Dufourea novaeangliae TaxID=178035 RepID=UPI0007672319|nr:PREDICTED: LOW QUALITY PROTEIN: uncharacterized protein LOC107190737 [Dufourea novaeangliae]